MNHCSHCGSRKHPSWRHKDKEKNEPMPRRMMFRGEYNLVKEGKCSHCKGTKQTTNYINDEPVLQMCHVCEGTGKPTGEMLKLAAIMDRGLCPHCEMPMDPEDNNYSSDECLIHLSKAFKALEIRVNTLIMAMTGNVQ